MVAATRTVAAYSGLAAACVVGATLGLVNRSRRVASNVTLSMGSGVALSLAGVSVEVAGEHNLWTHRPAVFIFNHQSLLDPLVVFKLVQRDITGVGKQEVAKQPGVAQFAWLINAALVDRGDSTQAKAALAPAVERLAKGCSITIAPEGTRSATARLGPFKKGAFHMAMQGGVPIVPVVLRNTGELLGRGSNVIRRGTVDVVVLPPVPVDGWTVADLDKRVREVRGMFVDALDDWPAAVASAASP
jgi:putative phosphoserine phosphatase/1-acylglycerol-3-phosphate O-acyltransferase